MSIPPASQLHPGLQVNIVLKADQPTGKLTQGTISDILTRGNHPRGIKVRLTTGQIGRVQTAGADATAAAFPVPRRGESYAPNAQDRRRRKKENRRPAPGATPQADVPSREGLSLLDYARTSSPRARKANGEDKGSGDKVDPQKQLETEFPELDTALIAAILSDHTDVVGARSVLKSLG